MHISDYAFAQYDQGLCCPFTELLDTAEMQRPFSDDAVSLAHLYLIITKACLFKYTEIFTTKKWKFSDEKF